MADNIEFLTTELQVNQLDPLIVVPPLNGLAGNQFNAEVTALSNNHFVVVYDNSFIGGVDDDIMAQEYDQNGVLVAGGPFRVNFDGADQRAPDVAQVNTGGYIAVWQDVNSGQQISMVKVVPGVTP